MDIALGGNMNIGTLKPLAFEEIMEGYAKEKMAEKTEADKEVNAVDVLELKRVERK